MKIIICNMKYIVFPNKIWSKTEYFGCKVLDIFSIHALKVKGVYGYKKKQTWI